MKFKVGDKVRILDGSNIRNYRGGYTSNMKNYVGKVYTISEMCKHIEGRPDGYCLKDDFHLYVWDERSLELVKEETIVIYRKNNEVIALDKSTGKKSVARCNPADTFDFMTGAKLAFERLTGEDKPKYREVERSAKPGEYVKIVNASYVPVNDDDTPTYKNGDILKIIEVVPWFGEYKLVFRNGTDIHGRSYILNHTEYVVLEGYTPEEPQEQPEESARGFKIGDIVRGASNVYGITNENMTKGEVVAVSDNGEYIDIRIIDHIDKCWIGHKFNELESKYFDLVKETKPQDTDGTTDTLEEALNDLATLLHIAKKYRDD